MKSKIRGALNRLNIKYYDEKYKIHVHNFSPERAGKVMTFIEMQNFAVEVLMSEYRVLMSLT